MNIAVGGGAVMPLPNPNAEWILRYSTEPNVLRERMAAASILAAYEYLIMECTQREALRRIKLIRKATLLGRKG